MDFANILFGGRCNRACPFCIGQSLPERVRQSNLDLFPPHNLDAFVDEVNRLEIRHIVFTGTTTDPQLYRHEARLLSLLRQRVGTGADYSLHTNGVLLLRKLEVALSYDKVCLSFPSFNADTYGKMMGLPRPPRLASIAAALGRRLKVSCLVTTENIQEIPSFLYRCGELAIPRVVLRYLYGESRRWSLLPSHQPVRYFRNNPVYDIDGLEVTVWEFESSQSTSLNLFSDGTLGRSYLLARTAEFRAPS